jgi:type IV secretion system protein TrbL
MLAAGSWYDQLNPFHYLAGAADQVVADGWTAAMLGLWNAGLWALRLVLNIMDAFLTPDLSENGPGADIYRTTFWIAGALVLVMVMVQLGVVAIRRDGKAWRRCWSAAHSSPSCGRPGSPTVWPSSPPAEG